MAGNAISRDLVESKTFAYEVVEIDMVIFGV